MEQTNPSMEYPSRNRGYDQYSYNNLDTLATLHLVKAILTLLFSFFFLLYMFMGKILSHIPNTDVQTEAPFNISLIFVIIGGIGLFFCLLFGVMNLLSYSYIKERKNYNFVFANAVINCLTGILGILLGVFTLIEINKPQIKDLFYKDSL